MTIPFALYLWSWGVARVRALDRPSDSVWNFEPNTGQADEHSPPTLHIGVLQLKYPAFWKVLLKEHRKNKKQNPGSGSPITVRPKH